jgi:hypothetical protein
MKLRRLLLAAAMPLTLAGGISGVAAVTGATPAFATDTVSCMTTSSIYNYSTGKYVQAAGTYQELTASLASPGATSSFYVCDDETQQFLFMKSNYWNAYVGVNESITGYAGLLSATAGGDGVQERFYCVPVSPGIDELYSTYTDDYVVQATSGYEYGLPVTGGSALYLVGMYGSSLPDCE